MEPPKSKPQMFSGYASGIKVCLSGSVAGSPETHAIFSRPIFDAKWNNYILGSCLPRIFKDDFHTILSHLDRFHDYSSTDISSMTLRLQTFRLLLYIRVQDSCTSNFCFSKSLFSSIPTSTYTMIPFINPTSTDTMIIQHIGL